VAGAERKLPIAERTENRLFALRAGKISCEEAYPRIEFSPGGRGLLAWLRDKSPRCVHLERNSPWSAKLVPDVLYVRGKRSPTRETLRPEVSLCRDCLIGTVEGEFAAYRGNVVAFEPDAELFSQYFFVGAPDFERAGLRPEVARAIERRLAESGNRCAECERPATWLWLSREQVESLDEVERIGEAPGEWLCAEHGAQELCGAFARITEANLFYVNLPYGEAGAYVWI
jgi:hypothetical protein